MNQSEFKANTCNRCQAREKTCQRETIGFGFTSYWLRKWREFNKPITVRSNAKPSKNAITFNTQLKTALTKWKILFINHSEGVSVHRVYVPFLSIVLFPRFFIFRFSCHFIKASDGGSFVPTWKMTLNRVPVPTTIKPRY